MIHPPRLAAALVFIAMVLLSGCGWQLKGNLQAEIDIEALYFDTQIPKYQRSPDSIETTIKQRLDQIGTRIVEIESSNIGLILVSETVRETVLSLTSDLFEQQVKLQKTVAYQIYQPNTEHPSTYTVTTARDVSADQSAAAAKKRERSLILEEINRELTERIILHAQRVAAESAAE